LGGRELSEHEATFILVSTTTRMSGVDIDGNQYLKGAADAGASRVVETIEGPTEP